MHDPRYAQITCLTVLLVYGEAFLDFPVALPQLALLFFSALVIQWLFSRVFRLPGYDPRSVLITCLSLALLLRTPSGAWLFFAVVVAVAGKFLIRYRNKHLFNPANLAIVFTLFFADQAWISPGQWGQTVYFVAFASFLGIWVLYRTRRSDVTLAFLLAYGSGLFLRAAWLGDPLAIPFHQLQNGSLLIFSFFMISDPKTLPDARAGRILFAGAVAAVAIGLQYGLYMTNGLMYALALCVPLVPLLDYWLPGQVYHWPRPNTESDGEHSC